MHPLSTSLVLCVGFTLCVVATTGTLADEAAPPTSTDSDAMTELRVILKGEENEPVVGAAVMPYAMRVVEQRGHGYWNPEKLGPPKDYFSDENGVAVIRYPAKVHAIPKAWTTRLITFQIRHSDYVRQVVHFDLVDPENPETEANVELKRGCEVQLSAVDENGSQVSDFGVLMAGPVAPEFWADDGKGGRRCSSTSDGTWQTLLVKPQDDGPTLFSSLIPLRVRPKQTVKIRNMKLSPGSQVVGTLADNVPRPVKNGRVITTTVPEPEEDSWSEELPSLAWHESAKIKADGSFVLPSVPREGQIQIIAVCDGWVSKTTVPEARSFVMGQLFPIDSKSIEVVVSMEPTGTLEVSLIKPDGSPLEGGAIGSWPNQRYYKGGSTLLGQSIDTIIGIRNQVRPADERKPPFERNRNLPFIQQEIKNGVAILRGLPAPSGQYLALNHDDYRLPSPVGQDRGEMRFKLESAEPKKLTVKVVPHSYTQAAGLLDGLIDLLDKSKQAIDPKQDVDK